tara:strand:+ start:1969 stop:3879 length:1911 start_codon:yes stop_codon:yes gene_type:complete
MDNRYPNFSWWQGIVEDRKDPDKLGRYRVRILGHHTKDKTTLPTEELPWSMTMQNVTSAAISGVGTSPTGLVEGSSVIGFFVDGEDGQIPVIMGSIGGMSVLPEVGDTNDFPDTEQVGFYDPNKKFPRHLGQNEDKKDIGKNVLFEADSSRLARGPDKSEQHYSTAAKRDTRTTKIPTGYGTPTGLGVKNGGQPKGFTHPKQTDGDESEAITISNPIFEPQYWDEPHPQGAEKSKSEYPYNHVRETESGHVFEVDDTPGSERIHEFHTAGTFYEIQPDGKKVTKVVGDDFEIDLVNKYLYVKGDFNITVDGDYNLNVKGNKYEHVSGHSFQSVKGRHIINAQGNIDVHTDSNYNLSTNANRNVAIGSTDKEKPTVGDDSLRVTGQMNQRTRGRTKIFSMSDFKHVSFGNMYFNAYPSFEPDLGDAVGEALNGGLEIPTTITSGFPRGGKIDIMGLSGMNLGTSALYPNIFTGNLMPAISMSTARLNLSATHSMKEMIGPLTGVLPDLDPTSGIGSKVTVATLAVNTSTGLSLDLFGAAGIIPGIRNTVNLAGTIENEVKGAGMIMNKVAAGGITNTVIAGGITSNVTAGGISNSVTAGGYSTNVSAGAVVISALAGTTTINGTLGVTVTGLTIALN